MNEPLRPSREAAPGPLQPAKPVRSWLSALCSGLLSLIFPGLGQVRAGSWSLGVTLLGVAAAAAALLRCLTWLHMEPLAFAVFATVRAAYILLAIAAAVDAVRRTRRTVKASRPG